MPNPFTPTFGTSPPVIAGRQELIDDFRDAVAEGPGSPARMTLYTGARGTGKTVMLNEVQDAARQSGWMVIAETATSGLVSRLVDEQLPSILAYLEGEPPARALSGVTIGGVAGVTWDNVAAAPVRGLRSMMVSVCEQLQARGVGLLLTVDEIHQGQIAELRDVATVMQHLVREE